MFLSGESDRSALPKWRNSPVNQPLNLSETTIKRGIMKSNPVGWFEIYVQDMPRAKAFYEAVFLGTLEELTNPDPQEFPDMEMWAFPMTMEGYGAPGALVKMEGYPSGGSTMVYFSCEDCSVESERAAQHGGKLLKGKMSIGENGFIALVEDTEGNTIGLHSMA
jgi:predicted enzyme related to lactoylglutathione lyase